MNQIKYLLSVDLGVIFTVILLLLFCTIQSPSQIREYGSFDKNFRTLASPTSLNVDSVTLIASWEPPFYRSLDEAWESESFEENDWNLSPENGNWNIDKINGNPGTSVQFGWLPEQYNYEYGLISKKLSANGLEEVHLSYDLNFSRYSDLSLEQLSVDIFNGNEWIRIGNHDNQNGSIFWSNFFYDISNLVIGNEYQVRFLAYGTNSFYFNAWNIDNIIISYSVGNSGDTLIGYNLYIDEILVGFTDKHHFQLNPYNLGATLVRIGSFVWGYIRL